MEHVLASNPSSELEVFIGAKFHRHAFGLQKRPYSKMSPTSSLHCENKTNREININVVSYKFLFL